MAIINFSHSKLWRGVYITINALIIITFIAPFSVKTAYALDIPQPIYPGNYATTTPDSDPPLGIPSFSWSAVSGATKYRLQVDSEIGFNTPIFLNITTKNRSYTPPLTNNLFADGEWYWRIRVEEPTPVGEWSEIMTFTKLWATEQNKPLLEAPDADELLAFFNAPVFSWTPVMGASRYRLQIATSPDGFNSPILSTDTLTTTVQPNSRLANGEYWWRVLPLDYESHFGTSSEIRNFTLAYGTSSLDLVPTLLEPADETYPTFTPTFRWTAVEGAELYRLEYTSDESCDFSVGTFKETRQTSFTPTDTFPNDARYCWRVRVESGHAVGDWSTTWHFRKQWYIQPHLLTPTNLYQNALYPIYSWTPVPGASRYKIEIADNPSFSPIRESYNTANTTYTPRSYVGTKYYYWRVTPIDGGGKFGLTSAVSEFQSNYDSTSPGLVYPLYYYLPNDPNYYGDYSMNPYEDRSVPYPIFIWHRVMIPSPDGGNYATAYRIQVDTTPYFNNLVWEYDTESTVATPIDTNDFIPVSEQDYYWRVCVLDHLGGNCRSDANAGWSQIWKVRFDLAKALPPTNGGSPELLRPGIGQESVETNPLLEWWPFQNSGQTQYQIEISRDLSFSTEEISQTVNIPAYAPDYSFAQRNLGRTDYGTFYWRVRAFDGVTWSDWSDTWRYQIASQSEWRYTRTLGDPANELIIGDDPADDVPYTYDLTSLYASQSDGFWFLGYNANLTITNMTYVFYIDLDHIDGSGAELPPERAYDVTTVSAHKPEYAIYVDKIDGIIDGQNTWVFAWNGNAWGFGQKISEIGGSIYASDGYVELKLPNGAIGMSQVTSSASVMLFSVDTDTGDLVDTVPSDPQVPGTSELSRFSAVSDHMNLVYPPSTATGDPSTIASILPFSWDWPTGSYPSNPFAGMKLEVHVDPNYTNLVAQLQINSTDSYFGENNGTFLDDFNGDNIYYWRVQPRYWLSGYSAAYGAWTSGWSFRRLGFAAQNLQTSVTWSTPTFSWDMVEGAHSYRLQVSTDPNFGSSVINQVTPMTSYTPQSTLTQGVYYWRVQVNRYDDIGNDWSQVEQFSLNLPLPTGLTPDNDTPVHYAPTFCWDPILEPSADPILAAWKYRVQVSRDENFSDIYDSVDTYNTCWTPTKGYADGAYWWHVAMIDGSNRAGSYSPAATFTKQYPLSELISPVNGVVSHTPTFIWTPVDGAATYRFEVSLFTTFDPLFDSITTINTQFTPTKIYDTDQLYYWRVAIRDRNGNQGPFSDSTIIIGKGNHLYLPMIKR
jgi:hypothetical protein